MMSKNNIIEYNGFFLASLYYFIIFSILISGVYWIYAVYMGTISGILFWLFLPCAIITVSVIIAFLFMPFENDG